MDEMIKKNQQKFSEIKKLNLPLGQYAITGSGALGIRNLREIGDIDIIVDLELWNTLAKKYGVIDENGIKKIVFLNGLIEAFQEDSFYTMKKDHSVPSITARINQADIIQGLPFESLEHVLYFKRTMGREKDLNDVLMIEAWQKDHFSET